MLEGWTRRGNRDEDRRNSALPNQSPKCSAGLAMDSMSRTSAALCPFFKVPSLPKPEVDSSSRKAVFAAISGAWWSPISGLCAETSSSGPFWRASLRGQKSRSKLEEGGLARQICERCAADSTRPTSRSEARSTISPTAINQFGHATPQRSAYATSLTGLRASGPNFPCGKALRPCRSPRTIAWYVDVGPRPSAGRVARPLNGCPSATTSPCAMSA